MHSRQAVSFVVLDFVLGGIPFFVAAFALSLRRRGMTLASEFRLDPKSQILNPDPKS
jgi:hypothetical protein